MSIPFALQPYLNRFQLPDVNSHKGQNGKLLLIGGSELFHAASKWSLDVAAELVDMVFYASVPSTNELVQQAKGQFWNGIVIPRSEIQNYIEEADAVLIGPGMERVAVQEHPAIRTQLTEDDWGNTSVVTQYLLARYPNKQWIIDAGALQMMQPHLLPHQSILTPHLTELERILQVLPNFSGILVHDLLQDTALLRQLAIDLHEAILLIKGPTDIVVTPHEVVHIVGGNAGMTKGGTGDVLAGLVAALACTQQPVVAAVVGSLVNKRAGEEIFMTQGVYYGASTLASVVPKTLWNVLTEK